MVKTIRISGGGQKGTEPVKVAVPLSQEILQRTRDRLTEYLQSEGFAEGIQKEVVDAILNIGSTLPAESHESFFVHAMSDSFLGKLRARGDAPEVLKALGEVAREVDDAGVREDFLCGVGSTALDVYGSAQDLRAGAESIVSFAGFTGEVDPILMKYVYRGFGPHALKVCGGDNEKLRQDLEAVCEVGGRVSEPCRTYYYYGLARKALGMYKRDKTGALKTGLSVVADAEGQFPAEERFWLYHGLEGEDGLGCTAMEVSGGKPEGVTSILTAVAGSLPPVPGGLAEGSPEFYGHLRCRRNFLLDTAITCVRELGDYPQDMMKAFGVITAVGEGVDLQSRPEYYSHTGSGAIQVFGDDLTDMRDDLQVLAKAGQSVTQRGLRSYWTYACPALLRNSPSVKGAGNLETAVSGMKALEGRVAGGLESYFWRDVVTAATARCPEDIQGLGVAVASKVLDIRDSAGLGSRSDDIKYMSLVAPALVKATGGTNTPIASLDVINATLADVRPECQATFIEYCATPAITYFNDNHEGMREWLSTVMEMASDMSSGQQLAFYQRDAAQILDVGARENVAEVRKIFGGDLGSMRKGLKSIAANSAGMTKREQVELYDYTAKAALKVSGGDVSFLEDAMSSIRSTAESMHPAERHAFLGVTQTKEGLEREGTGVTVFKVLGKNAPSISEALSKAKEKAHSVGLRELCGYWGSIVPAVMAASGGDTSRMDAMLDSAVDVLNSVEETRRSVFVENVVHAVAEQFRGVEDFSEALHSIRDVGESLGPGARSMFYMEDVPSLVSTSRGRLKRLQKGLIGVAGEEDLGLRYFWTIGRWFGGGVKNFLEGRAHAHLGKKIALRASSRRPLIRRPVRSYEIDVLDAEADTPLESYSVKQAFDESEIRASEIAARDDVSSPRLRRPILRLGPQVCYAGRGGTQVNPVILTESIPFETASIRELGPTLAEDASEVLGQVVGDQLMTMVSLSIRANYSDPHPHPYLNIREGRKGIRIFSDVLLPDFTLTDWTDDSIREEIRHYHSMFASHLEHSEHCPVRAILAFNNQLVQYASEMGEEERFERLIAEAQRMNATADPSQLGSREAAELWMHIYSDCERVGRPRTIRYTDK